MAIHFGAVKFIKRSAGRSATRVAAYNARAVVHDDRTGEVHNFTRARADLEHHEVLLPAGGQPEIAHTAVLSNMAEAAERRKDARVGREFIFALPHELSSSDRRALARSFVKEHFTERGLPVQIDIHRPHEEGSKNWHLHVWVPMRRLEGDRFAVKQATDLLPSVRTGLYGVFVSEAERWGRLWVIHQERFFYAQKLDLIVDPIAIRPSKVSYGPRRAWGENPDRSREAEMIAERRKANAEAARDPELVWQFAKQQKFDARALNRFLEKFVSETKEQQSVAERVYKLRDKDLAANKVPSGWRDLTVEDVARELDPDVYGAQVKNIARLEKELRKLDWRIDQRQANIDSAKHRAQNRWTEMGMARRALHLAGIYRDIDLENYESWEKRSQNSRATSMPRGGRRVTDWGVPIDRKTTADQLQAARQSAAAALEAIRPVAEPEFARRRHVAQDARAALAINQGITLHRQQNHIVRTGGF